MSNQTFEQRKEQCLNRLRLELADLSQRTIAGIDKMNEELKACAEQDFFHPTLVRRYLEKSLQLMRVGTIRRLWESLLYEVESSGSEEEVLKSLNDLKEQALEAKVRAYEDGSRQGTYHRLFHEQEADAYDRFLNLLKVTRNIDFEFKR